MIIATTNIVKYDLTWNVFFGRRKDIIVTTVVTATSQSCWYLATWHAIFGPSAVLYILQRVLAIVLVRLTPVYRVPNQRPYIDDKASPEAIFRGHQVGSPDTPTSGFRMRVGDQPCGIADKIKWLTPIASALCCPERSCHLILQPIILAIKIPHCQYCTIVTPCRELLLQLLP